MTGEWITRNILEEGEKGMENEEQSNTASDCTEREKKWKHGDYSKSKWSSSKKRHIVQQIGNRMNADNFF